MNISEIEKAINAKEVRGKKDEGALILIHKEGKVNMYLNGKKENIEVALVKLMQKDDKIADLILETANLYRTLMMESLAEKMGNAADTLGKLIDELEKICPEPKKNRKKPSRRR